MSAGQQFSLKWNNYSHHIVTEFEELRSCDDLTDVTLSCEGKRLKAHKILLSACSVYFKETFKENPCKHPVVILQGVSFRDLEAVVSFMYNGQLNISQENLSSFLETAQLLRIKGLTDKYNLNSNSSSKSAEKKQSPTPAPAQPVTTEDDDDSVVNTEPIPNLPNIEIFEVSKEGTSDALNESSSSQTRSLTPIPTPPPPKKKRIGPASFMKAISVQNQSENVSRQSSPSPSLNAHSASGSGIESGDESCSGSGAPGGTSSNDVSASTGGLLNPETVMLPSTSLGDEPQGDDGLPSSGGFSHGVVKIEEDDEEEEQDIVGIGVDVEQDMAYDKNNLSEDHDNDNSMLDVLDSVTVEEEPMPMPTIINSFNTALTASSSFGSQSRGVQILNGNFSSISNVNSNLKSNSNPTRIMTTTTPEESILPYEILNYPLVSSYFAPENRIQAPVPAKNRVLLLRRKTAPMNITPVPVSLPVMAQLPVSISGIQVQSTSVAGVGGSVGGGGHTSRSHTNKRKSFAVPRVFDISELSESSTSPTRTPADAVDMESWHKCSLCDKRYKCRSSLDSHIKIHQGEIAKCDICGQTMSRMRDLKRHVATVHRGLLEDLQDPLLSLSSQY